MQWFEDLPDNCCIQLSDTGYSNDRITLDWVKHFATYSTKSQVGDWRLLLLDGHECHLTWEFLDFCERPENKIIPFCLPPNSTHLLQPLDVVFQTYKHYHAEAVDAATRTGCSDFNKLEFFAALESIRNETFKKETVQSAFRKTGCIPYDPSIVLQRLQEYANNTPDRAVTPESQTDPPMIQTPRTVRTLRRQGDYLLDAHPSSPTYRNRVDKFLKGSLIQAHSGALAAEELSHTYLGS